MAHMPKCQNGLGSWAEVEPLPAPEREERDVWSGLGPASGPRDVPSRPQNSVYEAVGKRSEGARM